MWDLNQGSLQEQQMLLTAKLALWAQDGHVSMACVSFLLYYELTERKA